MTPLRRRFDEVTRDASSGDLVTVADRDGVRIITVNRPDKLNALTLDMLVAHVRPGVEPVPAVGALGGVHGVAELAQPVAVAGGRRDREVDLGQLASRRHRQRLLTIWAVHRDVGQVLHQLGGRVAASAGCWMA